MKHILIKSIVIIFTVSAIVSCADSDFLQESNPNVLGVDTYWRDLSDTQTGLNATYKTLHNPAVLNVIAEILRSDMGYPGYGRPVPQNTEDFYLHLYNASTSEILEKWQTNYQGIFRANQVIQALENLEGTVDETEWTSQMAQARFFRGLFHYYLYTTYNSGSIIIRKEVPEVQDSEVPTEEFYLPLSPAEDVIKFVREDLEYAYQNLYKKGEYPSGDASRVTSGAAATILGTSYLQELDYEKAMPYFDDVINNHGYELEYDLDKMFTTAGEFNKESIFEINFTSDFIEIDLNRWNGDTGTNWLNQQTSNTRGAVGPAWIAYAYKSEPMDPLDLRNYYQDANNDDALTLRDVPLRASSMIALVDDNQTTYYLTGTASEYPRFHGLAWGYAWWKKYTNDDIVAAENQLPSGAATLSSKNVTLNRLPEVMLMQAECKIKTGDVDEALNLINDIRKRWGLVLLGLSGSDVAHTYDEEVYNEESLMQHLMRVEKPLEMSVEGHLIRFLDFQRWKKSDNYGFKERLEELANEEYYGVNFTYVNSEGATKIRNNFPSIEGEKPSGSFTTVDYEYDIPFLNYTESVHGTYPIPFDEVNANPNIN
ncbi:RagB/SusD family nutrient uptake outer membrane protein [uncultured Algibacter sp.]|uniref:RagB/SusD family nutrient uptake outer membrane protein n=1 Tax=uncultured Algibacter sp. TaxID=298659 RepID=UPI0026068EEF|nr:RagB/SusD family nutrient uptake outer membrane protein [uncultured Algibacter sp.]